MQVVKLKITKIEEYPESGSIHVFTETIEQQFTRDLLHELGTMLPPIVIERNKNCSFATLSISEDFFDLVRKQKDYFMNSEYLKKKDGEVPPSLNRW